MAVTSGSAIARADVEALFALANGKTSMTAAPYTVPTAAAWPDWVDPAAPGGSAYGAGAQVSWGGGLFYSLASGNTAIPTNTTYWKGEAAVVGYDGTATYHKLDVVSSGGYNWVSTGTQTNNPPINPGTGVPNMGWIQHYLSAYNRLRTDLQGVVANPTPGSPRGVSLPQLTVWQQALFGPWPCAASPDYNNLVYTYPDTGGTVTVSIGASAPAYFYLGYLSNWTNSSYQRCTNPTSYPSPTFVATPKTTSATYNLIVGGTQAVTLSATLIVSFQYQQGVQWNGTAIQSDGTDPTALASIDASGWIPGAGSWVKSSLASDAYNGVVFFTCTINTTVNPGTYLVTLNGNIGGDDVVTPVTGGAVVTYPSRCYRELVTSVGGYYNGWMTMMNGGSYAMTISGATAAIGIHNTKAVYAIAVPNFDTHPLPAGLFSRDYEVYYTASASPPVTAYNLQGPYPHGAGITASTTTGFWTGLIPPVGQPPFESALYMPWNLFYRDGSGNATNPPWPPPPYTGGTAYTSLFAARAYSIINEAGKSPQGWNALTYYPLGYVICDSNGNFQQVTIAGHSSSSPPLNAADAAANPGSLAWGQNVGNVTHEPLYPGSGSHAGTNFTGVQWVCIASPCPGRPYNPAAARMFSQPAYPVLKSTDTWAAGTAVKFGQLILDTHGDVRVCVQAGTTGTTQPGWTLASTTIVTDGTVQWGFYLQGAGYGANANATAGFTGGWIYRVNINDPAASGATSCQIGCIRNGSFVSFGTFTVGGAVNVLWPIFTNSPLVYVCSARLDIQAMFFGGGTTQPPTTPPAPWGAIGWPLLASYYNDINTLLGLIV